MSSEIDSASDVVTAGLVAHELDGGGDKPAPAHAGPCANCGAMLQGPYCHQCGQVAHVHRSLWHIAEEALHGILHFDSKIFRTLPLLFARPGLLTRRYIDGQRARYVAPFALFLFDIFLFAFVSSALSHPETVQLRSDDSPEEARAELAHQVDEQRALVTEHKTELADTDNERERKDTQFELRVAQLKLDALVAGLATFDAAQRSKQAADAATPPGERDPHEPSSEVKRQALETVKQALALESWAPMLAHVLDRALENPDLALYKLKSTASKLAFLLVPIALPFLWLMFIRRPDVALYDHAIFTLYSIGFMALWFVLLELVGTVHALAGLGSLMAFVPFLHVFLQLKETYGLSIGGALWRTAALGVVTGISALVFLCTILLIAFH